MGYSKEGWRERIETFGVTRSIFNIGHKTEEELAAVTAMQRQVIFPLFRHAVSRLEPTPRGLRALDFGCGWGRWTAAIAKAIDGLVYGVDPTEELVRAAKPQSGAMFQVIDPEQPLPFPDGVFDIVWSCVVLSTILDDEDFRRRVLDLQRVLRPGGLMFIVDHTEAANGGQIVTRWSRSRLHADYLEAFKPIDLVTVGEYFDLGEKIHIFAGYK